MEFGEAGFSQYGTGNYVQQLGDEEAVLEFGDFSGGYFSPVNREMVPENTAPYAVDIEVTRNNRLKRSPGTTPLEIFETRTPGHIVVHGSLDFTAELLLFDFPYLGVKRIGDTVWANKALADIGWFAWANFGGTFIFTDGVKVYARQVNDGTTLTELIEAPVALAYASWAGRMWAFAGVIDGNFEPLGIIWSAADSDYTDWTGLGAGFELLIDQISSGDRGVALVPMGLDFMAVFLRKSIWIARRTGLADRPGDLQPRVPTKGAVNSSTPIATQEGVIYLTDSGVELFDGNTSTHISYQIDAELLPLDYSEILHYTASFNPTTSRYYLHTPSGTTWIYELEFKRWIRRSLDAIESVIWPLQDEDAVVEGRNRVVFLGDHVDESLSQRAIEVEDQASELYFGTAQTPIWSLRPTPQQALNLLLTSKQFNLEYEGVADIELWAPNNNGVYEALVLDSLISQSPPDVVEIYAAKTGRLASLQLRITHGDAEFIHLQVLYINRGPRVALGEGGIPGNFSDRTSLQVFPQGSVAPWTSGPGGLQRPTLIMTTEQLSPNRFRFTLTGTDVPGYPVDSWTWDFGDGETEVTTVNTVVHAYDEAGDYIVSVIAKSDWYSFGSYPYGIIEADEPVDPVDLYPAQDNVAGTPSIGSIHTRVDASGGPKTWASMREYLDVPPAPYTNQTNTDNGFLNMGLYHSGGGAFDTAYWQQLERIMLRFDTSQLPADPISGTVSLTVATLDDWGSPPVHQLAAGLGALILLCYNRPLSDSAAAANADYLDMMNNSFTPAVLTVIAIATLVPGQPFTFPLDEDGLAHINRDGFTCFSLMFIHDFNDDEPSFAGFPFNNAFDEVGLYSAKDLTRKPVLHLEF